MLVLGGIRDGLQIRMVPVLRAGFECAWLWSPARLGDCALSELQGRIDLWVLSLGLFLGPGKGSARPCGTQVECWSDWRDFLHTPLRDQSQVNLDSYLLRLLPWTLSWFACSHSHKSFFDRETLLTPRCFSLPVQEASVAPSSGG